LKTQLLKDIDIHYLLINFTKKNIELLSSTKITGGTKLHNMWSLVLCKTD